MAPPRPAGTEQHVGSANEVRRLASVWNPALRRYFEYNEGWHLFVNLSLTLASAFFF
jgi:hypothetical protein